MNIAKDFEDYSAQYEAITESIQNRTATVEAANGDIVIEATLTGTLRGLRISPQALRRYDTETLSEFLLDATNEALARGAHIRLEELRPLIGAAADTADTTDGRRYDS